MKVVGIIPARMGSSRFPGKPLAKICNRPMIEHVYKRSKLSQSLDEVYIATCDEQIKTVSESFGAKVIMTKDTHEGASDRVAEAMLKIEQDLGKKLDAVVMIQGDEPMLSSEMIDQSVAPVLKDKDILVTNLISPIKTQEEHEDPNEVKVVVDKDSFALYFSREPIPSRQKGAKDIPMLKQVCIISFKRDFLLEFNSLERTPLEIIESVDMMRVLEYGFRVKMVPTQYETYSVDTLEDLEKVNKLMEGDSLAKKYI